MDLRPPNILRDTAEMRNGFFQTLGHKLFSTRCFSDVTFVVDGEEFHLHKVVLAASCPYFETMLFEHTNEASMKTITLRDTPKKLFEKVVRFIYSGEFVTSDLTSKEFVDVISLANEYQFMELLTHAISVATLSITENSSVDFVASILNLPFIHEQKGIEEKCLDFFDRFASSMVKNIDAFATLSPKSMCALIARDTFEAPEVDIFTALKMWFETRGSKNDDYVVFSKLRLNLISVADFNRIVKPTNLVSCESYLLALEYMASKRASKKIDQCPPNDSTTSSQIIKCYVQRSNGTPYQIIGGPAKTNVLTIAGGETMVIDVKEITCKVNFVRFTFKDASYFNQYQLLKLIRGSDSKMFVPSWRDPTHVEYEFPPQVVDRLEFKPELVYFIHCVPPGFLFEVEKIEIL